jgi:hypothetical protein
MSESALGTEVPTEREPEAQRLAEPPIARRFRVRPQRPILGPSFLTFGTLLWAYVTFGELVIGGVLPEQLAFLAVLAIFVVTAAACGKHSVALAPPRPGTERGRLVLPGAAGFLLWLATVLFVSTLWRTHSRSADALITLVLLVSSITAALYGRRWSAPHPADQPVKLRVALLVARILGALLTLIVIARSLSRL